MTIERIRAAYSATPFHAFVVHMADGRHIPVLSSEFMGFSPSGRTITVNTPDDAFHILDLLLVTDLEFHKDPNLQSSNGPSDGIPAA
jgi:hypothetical protein